MTTTVSFSQLSCLVVAQTNTLPLVNTKASETDLYTVAGSSTNLSYKLLVSVSQYLHPGYVVGVDRPHLGLCWLLL